MNIKVLFFDHSTQFGGAERSLLDIISSIHFNSVFVSPGPFVLSKFKTYGIQCILFPMPAKVLARQREAPFSFTDIYNLPILIFRFIILLNREKPTLVYTNTQKAHFIGMIAAKFIRIPHICHFRDIFSTPRDTCNTFSKFWLKSIFLFSTRIIAISKAVANQFPCSKKIRVIYNGIRVENSSFHPPKADSITPSFIPVIGYIGQIARWKGIEYFIRAAQLIASRTPARFTIIGSPLFGDVEYMEELKMSAHKLELDGKIEFQAEVDNPLDAISNFDILIHPPILPEPFGRVLIEAGALGKPVVATTEGAIPEIVIDKETGFLVPSKNPSAIADAVCDLIANPELIKSMGEKGKERVAKYFNITNMIDEIEEVIYETCHCS